MVQRGTEKVMSRPDKGRRVDRENGGQSRCGIWEDRVDDRRERREPCVLMRIIESRKYKGMSRRSDTWNNRQKRGHVVNEMQLIK